MKPDIGLEKVSFQNKDVSGNVNTGSTSAVAENIIIERLIMKYVVTALALALMSKGAFAQSTFLSASPIPEDAEKRFCYYEGLAYSLSAFIVRAGSNQTTESSGNREEALLQCVSRDDGTLEWAVVSNMKLGR